MHTMVSGLLCHAAGQLKVLKYTLMNLDARENPAPTKQYLGELDGDTGDEYDAGEAVYRKISECVQHYDSIFEFVNRVEDTFSFVIFSQFLASTIVICISCLQMSKESMTSISFFNSTLFCIAMLNEIFVFCYYGTILFEDSITVLHSIYMSNWYTYDQKSKKALLILMERTKRPILVKAGNMLHLSLDTFSMRIAVLAFLALSAVPGDSTTDKKSTKRSVIGSPLGYGYGYAGIPSGDFGVAGIAGLAKTYEYGLADSAIAGSGLASGIAHSGSVYAGAVPHTHQYRHSTQEHHVSLPHPVPVPITRTVSVPQPIPVDVPHPVPVPVHTPVPVDVPRPYHVSVPQPVPVPVHTPVPVDVPRPYPVEVTRTVPVEVSRPVYIKERHPVPVPVPQAVPVEVPTPVAVRVPQPITVHVPQVVKTVSVSGDPHALGHAFGRLGHHVYADAGATSGALATGYGGALASGYGNAFSTGELYKTGGISAYSSASAAADLSSSYGGSYGYGGSATSGGLLSSYIPSSIGGYNSIHAKTSY